MSGLSNFSFTTGTGPMPGGAGPGGNEFAVGVGTTVIATVNLAVNSNITAGAIDVGDSTTVTPGSSSSVPGDDTGTAASNLNLGIGNNVFDVNTLQVGGGKATGNIQASTLAITGSITIAGAAGGTSTANIIVGLASAAVGGNDAASRSTLILSGLASTVQAGMVIDGELLGGAAGTKAGGQISFDTGTFNAVNIDLAFIPSNTTGTIGSGKTLNGEFDAGSGSTTSTLNVTGSFDVATNNSSQGPAVGIFQMKGGTANIFNNIIDNSTGSGASTTTVSIGGGILNMEGFAIGPKTATGNSGTIGTRNITSVTLPSGNATIENLGGTGINDAGVNMNASGNLILDGNNTYTGTTQITSGTLTVGSITDTSVPAVPFLNPTTTLTDNGVLAFGSNFNMSEPGVVTGSGGITQSGSATTTLSNTNTYTGATNVTRGVLLIGDGGADGTIGTNTTATMTVNGTLAFNRSDNAISIPNPIVGTGAIQQLGSGTSTLSGNNSYVGGTTVTNGDLVIASPNALGFGGINTKSPPGTSIATGATLDLAGQTITQAISLGNGSTLTNSSATAANVGNGVLGVGVTSTVNVGFTGDASVTFTGSGTGAAATAVLGVTNATFAITNGGSGYIGSSGNPAVTITGGGGTGATASAIVTQTVSLSGTTMGTVTGIKITSPGINYTSAPTIVIAAPTTGSQAAAVSNATNFVLDGIQQTAAGSGYFTAPIAIVTATAGTATLGSPVLSGLNLTGTANVGGTGNIFWPASSPETEPSASSAPTPSPSPHPTPIPPEQPSPAEPFSSAPPAHSPSARQISPAAFCNSAPAPALQP